MRTKDIDTMRMHNTKRDQTKKPRACSRGGIAVTQIVAAYTNNPSSTGADLIWSSWISRINALLGSLPDPDPCIRWMPISILRQGRNAY